MPDMQDLGCVNLRWALALLDGLIEGGMRRLVISPGSRSTPLVLAGQRRPELELALILDERSAAFFALGAARASGRPVGVLCTSGSAPAHWLPAVIEASESEIPLVLLSADRPPELRGWGANQTIDQTRLFGSHVRTFHDPGPAEGSAAGLKAIRALGLRSASESLGRPPGPVHLNLPFREPLVPRPKCPELALADHSPVTAENRPARGLELGRAPAALQDLTLLPSSGRGLICCGPGLWSPSAADALWRCAERLGVPVLCDPLSGLRLGPGALPRISRYDSFLRNAKIAAALRPDWVLRFGRAPVSKTLMSWLAGIPTLLVDPGRRWSDPNHDVRQRVAAEPADFCEWLADVKLPAHSYTSAHSDWLRDWRDVETRVDALASRYLTQAPWCEAQLIQQLLELLPEGEGLLCANSMPIRQLDTWSGSWAKRLQLFGNRGASGIDGQTSTLAGLSAGGVPTTGLLGDLSFLHDLSGLQLLRSHGRPCIVINNGGGRIFDYLPQYGLPGFERLWRTPVEIDLQSLVEPFGLLYQAVSTEAEFREAVQRAIRGSEPRGRGRIIEVVIDGDLSRRVHQDFWRSLQGSELA